MSISKKQGYDWLFKVTFTLPGNESSVEGDKIYFVMKTSAAVDGETVEVYTSLTDSGNLSGTTVTAYVEVPKATTKSATAGDYVGEFYWQVAGVTTKEFPIGGTQSITVLDAIKDNPT